MANLSVKLYSFWENEKLAVSGLAFFRRLLRKVVRVARKQETYVALLRGINVGGKNVIPMADLRQCLEIAGMKDVTTYIQSGNVLFRSAIGSNRKLVAKLEQSLSDAFAYQARVVVIKKRNFDEMVACAHRNWGRKEEQKHNAMFLVDEMDADKFLQDLPSPKKGIESVSTGQHVIFWSVVKEKQTQSSMLKVGKSPEYQLMTVRNHKTTWKLVELLGNYDS